MKKVYIKFPKIGLGNLLLHWAKGYAFAKQNNLKLYKSSWWGVRLGPWLRREEHKRIYWGYFQEDSFFKKINLAFFRFKAKIIFDPVRINENADKNILYVFDKFHVDGDYFKEAKPYRDEIKKKVYEMLHPKLKKKMGQYATPIIGIHIRRGDFKIGSYITPTIFFVDIINRIRKECGQNLPVTVFTDASDEELTEVYNLSNVKKAEKKEDILDILLLGQSKICVLSVSSTFSFWGAFLNDNIVIHHPEEWHPLIRPSSINSNNFEGRLSPDVLEIPWLLRQNLSELSTNAIC